MFSEDLDVALSFRDGSPYCEKDYQGLFGVKCEACQRFITGKVLEVSDRGLPSDRCHCPPCQALIPAVS